MCDGFESERNQCEDLGSRQGMQAEKGPHSFTSQLDPHFTTTEMAEAGIPAVDRTRLDTWRSFDAAGCTFVGFATILHESDQCPTSSIHVKLSSFMVISSP